MHDKFDNNNYKFDSGFPYQGKFSFKHEVFSGKYLKMEIFRLENYRFYISAWYTYIIHLILPLMDVQLTDIDSKFMF